MGQGKTYLGFEVSMANDLFTISDKGDYLKNVPLYNGTWGFNLRQEVGKIFFVESGFLVKFYQQGFGFKTIPYYGSSSGDPSWLIPARLGLNVNLLQEKVYLTPVVGYSFGINPLYRSYGLGYGTSKSSTTSIVYSYTETPNSSRYFSLFQVGLGIEFKLFRTLRLSTLANYYSGLNKVNQLNIAYTVNNSTAATGIATSKGQFWSIGVGLKYPISNFWNRM